MSREETQSGGGQPPTEPPPALQVSDASIHVFISYASQDVAVADAIVATLEGHGVACWIAPRDVKAGALYADAIVRAISGATALVLVLSENSVASPHVGKEIERACSKQRSIIALRIDEAPLSPALEYFLGESQWVDARAGSMDAAVAKLVAAIREHPRTAPAINPPLTSATSALNAPALSHELRHKRLLLAAACAVVVMALAWILADRFWISKHVSQERPAATASPAAAHDAIAANSERSIAVLPFVDMSEKKDQEYFSDGLSEELIDLLAQVQDLHVPARTSSFYFKGKQSTIAEIAKALGVSHVLEGSVRKSGNTLRVTAQLIRADSGYHLWSKSFDRDVKDIFKVQDEIAAAVVEALKAKLLPAPQLANAYRTTNTEAYNQYLLGNSSLNRGNEDGLRSALQAYRKAIALDPNYAAAYAGLAFSEFLVADTTGDAEMMQRAVTAAERAIALAPDLPFGYVTRGVLRSTHSWDWTGAQADFEKALALDPGDGEAQNLYGGLLASVGRLPEAIAAERKAIELDPLSGWPWEGLGIYLMASGQFAAARQAISRALELNPEASPMSYSLGRLELLEGHAQEALTVFRRIGFEALRQCGSAMAEHTLGHAKESQQALDELAAKHSQEAAYQIAQVYAWRGEKDHAIEWLQRAYAQHDDGLSLIKYDPVLATLRADARYAALLKKLGLPE
jgi:TolB-like protein/Flp pilus assembly protein TadD